MRRKEKKGACEKGVPEKPVTQLRRETPSAPFCITVCFPVILLLRDDNISMPHLAFNSVQNLGRQHESTQQKAFEGGKGWELSELPGRESEGGCLTM